MADRTRYTANLVSDNNLYVDITTDRVGIGTTNPSAKLHVIGDGRFTGVVTASSFSGNASSATFATIAGISTNVIGGIGSITQLQVTGISTFNSNVIIPSSSVGIGTTNPLQRLQVGTANTLGISTDGKVFVVTSNADVGIGTTNPTSKLHVLGDARIVGTITATTFAGTATSTTNIPNLTGDITSVNTVTTLATVNSNVGTYGGTGAIPVVTVNAKGLVTGVSTVAPNNGQLSLGVSGTGLSGSATFTANQSGNSTFTVTSNATSDNTNSTIVARNASGGFSAGIITATLSGNASSATYATSAGVATALQNARTFEITGDIIASPISFDGTGNVSLAATIQLNSVALGSDTTGDYVANITGTSNQITVTSGTGEGSTPTLSIPNQFTAPQDVTVTRDLQVNRNLNVTGNITIGGTSATIFSQTLNIFDPDIVLGFRTDGSGNDVSNDNTANHGGVAVASTEGTPLVQLFIAGIETNPATYKKIMWFKSGTFSGLGTDAWLSNYAVGIGSTQFPTGTRLAAGSVQFTQNDLAVVRNINASGIVTATNGFVGALTGTATSTTNIPNLTGDVTSNNTVTTLATVNSNVGTYGDAGAIPSITVNAKGLVTGVTTVAPNNGQLSLAVSGTGLSGSATFTANQSGSSTFTVTSNATSANTASAIVARDASGNFSAGTITATLSGNASSATYATSAGIATYATNAGVSTNVIGGIGSITQLQVTGISTFTNGPVLIGAAASTGTASQRLQVTGGAYFSGTANVGIGTTNPQYIFTVTDTGTPATTGLSNCLADFTTTANSYGQINLRNTSTGTNASSDIVITADNGTDSSNFIDLGINNSGFSVGSWTINGATDGYLYTSDTNLSIGVAAANKYLSFFTGGTLISNERMRINAIGVGIGTTNPTSKLDVLGNSIFTGILTARNAATQDSISLNGRAGGTSSFNLSLTPTTLAASRTVTFQDITGTVYVSGGTDVTLADGGTNASLTASNGGIVYSTATAMAILSGTATAGQMLRSGASGAPSWSTATFPNTATTAGTILRADGTNWAATSATYPTTTTINQILYSSAANTISGITAANTSALVTSSGGVPSFTSGTTANRLLRTDGTTVSFAQAVLTSDVSGTLPIANGGTNSTASPTNGGISYGTGSAFAFTAAGTSGQVLISTGAAAPVWSSNLNISGISTIANLRITPVGTGATVGGIGVTYYGDGSQLTGISAGGSGDGSDFNTGITTTVYYSPGVAATSYPLTGIGISFPSTASRKYLVESIHVTNSVANDMYVTAEIDYNGGAIVPLTNRILVPYQGALEIIDEPLITNPLDKIRFLAYTGIGTTAGTRANALDCFITYATKTGTDYIGTGATITQTIAGVGYAQTVFTSTTYPSIINTIVLTNYSNFVDVDASVFMRRGGTVQQGYFVYNLTVPQNSSVQILPKAKRLNATDTIVVNASQANSLSVNIAGKYVV